MPMTEVVGLGADSPSIGLSEQQAQRILALEGFNDLPAADRRGLGRIVADVLREPMFALLLGAGLLYLLGSRPPHNWPIRRSAAGALAISCSSSNSTLVGFTPVSTLVSNAFISNVALSAGPGRKFFAYCSFSDHYTDTVSS